MNRRYGVVAATAVCVTGLVFTSGCSKSNKGTNTNTLTKDQQYVVAQSYLESVVPLVVEQFGTKFWDGVDQSDLVVESSPLALGKRTTLVSDSVSLQYEELQGWWILYAHLSAHNGIIGTMEITLRDSVRFATLSGRPQIQPNDSTDLFKYVSSSTFLLQTPPGDTSLKLNTSGKSTMTAVGLTDTVVTVNGSVQVSIDADAMANADSAIVSLDLQADVANVKVTNDSANACPSSGAMSVTLDMDVDVVEGQTRSQASGAWQADAVFTGQGTANVNFHSGDFHRQVTQPVCQD